MLQKILIIPENKYATIKFVILIINQSFQKS